MTMEEFTEIAKKHIKTYFNNPRRITSSDNKQENTNLKCCVVHDL